MNKIQYKTVYIFLVLLIFISLSLYFLDTKTHDNAAILIQGAEQRQSELLATTVKTLTKNMNDWCYDYTYWDDMVKFVKHPDPRWAKRNIESSAINYDISFAWVFDSELNQMYGYQTLMEKELSNSFIGKGELIKVTKKNWFSNFYFLDNGKIFEIHTAPIQPSLDIERKTIPKGWLLVGKIYKGKLLNDISNTTNSNIKIVLPDLIKSFNEDSSINEAGVYANMPLEDLNQNTIGFLTSFHIDKAVEKYITSAHESLPFFILISFLFFGSVFLFLLIYIVKPITILSKSLHSEDEAMLIPLIGKKNEFGALSRMMEGFFIQKKHLETEIKIRTETEIELKEIQINLEHLVEARTAELLNATNLMQGERDQAKLYLEMAGAVICLLDEKANILLINKMGYDVLGYKEGELIGKNWMDFCYDEDTANACNVRFGALMNGTEDYSVDYTFSLLTSKGEERKLLINSIVTKNPFNGSRAILFSGVDITAIKKTENDLIEAIGRAEKANKAQAAFFANMSHELRTPLFGILGYSDMMATGDYDEEIKHMASTINKGGKRLIETLNKVLNLSKLKADKFEIKLSEVSINKLISETVNLFQADAASKGLNLSFSEPDFEIITQTDNAVIRDIMNNLIHNAIKFTFYGEINILLQSDKNSYIIIVKDTGIGIPPSGLNLIFEEFRQVSEGYSRSFEGTGLGLAIIKKYLDLLQ
ncbi:MAG: ATP-binding protein, partial [Ignavibacteria bacterium]|nr:ATP-binding protein [Ignavibacteria bacterium]